MSRWFLCNGYKWGPENTLRTAEFGLGFVALTFKSMFQTVLHDDKKLLQWGIVWVQCAAQVQCRLNQALDAQLGHVHQVKPLDGNGVLGIWKSKIQAWIKTSFSSIHLVFNRFEHDKRVFSEKDFVRTSHWLWLHGFLYVRQRLMKL